MLRIWRPPVLLASALCALLAAESARAGFIEQGLVDIIVRAGGVTISRQAEQILETDEIQSITIGDQRRADTHVEGFLSVGDEGTGEAVPRSLGAVSVEFGTLVLNGSWLVGDLEIGESSDTATRDPSAGQLSLELVDFQGPINVRVGSAGIVQSVLRSSLFVAEAASATATASELSGISSQGQLELIDTSVPRGTISASGVTTFRGTSFDLGQLLLAGDVFVTSGTGDPVIGGTPARNDWTIAGRFDLGGPGGSDVELSFVDVTAATSFLRAGEARLSGGSTWAVSDFLRLYDTAPVNLTVRGELSAGSLDVLGTETVLTVTGAAGRLEVAGDARIGRAQVGSTIGSTLTGPGTLRVAEGAVVVVGGLLTIHPEATLDLQPGGIVYANAVDAQGTILENGGTLVVPEPSAALGGAAALVALALAQQATSSSP